nr:hypothetical protein [Vibrio splendidus]MCC4882747.1 hypothetical protein [Vibrio splendidus]
MKTCNNTKNKELSQLKTLIESGVRPVVIINETISSDSLLSEGMRATLLSVSEEAPMTWDNEEIKIWRFEMDINTFYEHNSRLLPELMSVSEQPIACYTLFDSVKDGKISFDLEDASILSVTRKGKSSKNTKRLSFA